jgi:hypothetical protein
MDLFLVRGPKRSGNHLLIHWLSSFYPGYFLCNNCYPKHFKSKEEVVAAILGRSDPLVIFSFEHPQCLANSEFDEMLAPCRHKYTNAYAPFILRDPYNWMASFLYKQPVHPTKEELEASYSCNGDAYWDIWLQCFDLWSESRIRISFNEFVSNKEFRKNLAREMGLVFDPVRDNDVLSILWQHEEIQPIPSSFDAAAIEAREMQPKEMQVFGRYKKVEWLFEEHGIPQGVVEKAKDHWEISCSFTIR